MRARFLMLGAALALCLSACGSQPSSTGANAAAQTLPLTGADILVKPQSSGLQDAHFTMTEHLPSGASGTGDGVLVYKPQPAWRMTMHFPSSVPGQTATVESLVIGGTFYSRAATDAQWTSIDGPWNLASMGHALEPTLVGEENTAQGKAWHVIAKTSGGDPFDFWVREKDSYPLKYSTHQANGAGTYTLVFDRYNTGETLSAPPPSQVKPG
jgi:hypothetical protein